MWPPRIMAKLSALEKRAEPGSMVTVSLPALMRSAIDLGLGGVRADAEEAVLALEDDLDALGDVVGHQGRHADAEVHVVAVPELLGGALGDLVAGQALRGAHHAAPFAGDFRSVFRSMRFS